jgi:hypothetical protein
MYPGAAKPDLMSHSEGWSRQLTLDSGKIELNN